MWIVMMRMMRLATSLLVNIFGRTTVEKGRVTLLCGRH